MGVAGNLRSAGDRAGEHRPASAQASSVIVKLAFVADLVSPGKGLLQGATSAAARPCQKTFRPRDRRRPPITFGLLTAASFKGIKTGANHRPGQQEEGRLAGRPRYHLLTAESSRTSTGALTQTAGWGRGHFR